MNKNELLTQTLFESVYGSKLYGTYNDTSDTDIKYIFFPPLRQILLGKQVMKTKFLSNPSDEESDKSKQVDEDFIPIQKFAYDFFKGIPYAVEVAFSPAVENITPGSPLHLNWVRRSFLIPLREKFLTAQLSGFLGYVNNIWKTFFNCYHDFSSDVITKSMTPKEVYHGIRVANETTELLLTGNLKFPLKNAEELKKFKYASVVTHEHYAPFEQAVEEMEEALIKTNLQPSTEELQMKFEDWLYDVLRELYSSYHFKF